MGIFLISTFDQISEIPLQRFTYKNMFCPNEKKNGFKTRLHTKLTSLKKAGNETECPAHCVIKRSL